MHAFEHAYCFHLVSQISENALVTLEVPHDFDFALDEHVSEAKLLHSDNRVSAVRYSLVPSEMSESEFWRRLFYILFISNPMPTTPVRHTSSYEELPDSAFLGSPCLASTSLVTGLDFTPRGTAVGAYDEFSMTPPRR